MPKHESRAELWLAQHRISIYGTVDEAGPLRVTLRLQTLPADCDVLVPGSQAELAIEQRDSVVTAAVAVDRVSGARVSLRLLAEPAPLQRRSAPRVACELPVMFRSIRPDGCTGAWRHAVTSDVGSGGMRLVVEGCVGVSGRVELSFHIADDERPLRAIARTAHCRPAPGSRLAVGLAFVLLTPMDRFRLDRYLSQKNTLPA